MIFTKAYAYTSDEKVEKLPREFNIHYRACTRKFNIHYRACIGSLIYLLYTRGDLSFAMHKVAKFSSNPGKVQFEGLVPLLRSIRDNKTLWLNYFSDINDAPVSDLLRQASIKTENQLMDFSDSIWKDFPNTGISTG